MPRPRLTYTKPQIEIFFPEVSSKFNAIPKGRRFGGTQGGAHAYIEWALDGEPMLWGDTIFANIARYLDRYFIPALESSGESDPVAWKWEERKQVLKIGDRGGYIDFRSADKPENWEGFGYKRIFLNEAGIILKNKDLYVKTVLPMLMDYPESKLYAIGTPKGKKLRDGTEHPFFTIARRGELGHPNYRTLTFSSYDNPLLSKTDIDELADEIANMEPGLEDQEIWGKFLDRVAGNPFAFAFEDRHIGKAQRRPNDLHYFSIDFNVEPFCAIAAHIWQDAQGHHAHTFTETALKVSSIEAMAEWIRTTCPMLHLIRITGDRNGYNRAIGKNGPTILYNDLQRALNISKAQIEVPGNPTHMQSREDTNYVLANHPDYIIDTTCTGLISDYRGVEVDGQGKIMKSDRSKANQRADFLDGGRYMINTYLRKWIQQSRR